MYQNIHMWVITILAVIIFLWAVYRCAYKENYGDVLGGLAPYQKQIAQALKNSDQQPVDRRMQPANNYNAGKYIESVFTQMRKNNIPPQEPQSDLVDCQTQCKSEDFLAENKCVGMCNCRANVIRYCKNQVCDYSSSNKEWCMKTCIANKSVNCNQVSWNYMFGTGVK